MILRPDGTPYRVLGTRQQFDDGAVDHDLFNLWDQEAIKIGGTPLFYYEMFLDDNTIDPLYLESRGKLFSRQPVQLYGFYEPIPAQNAQTAYGIDSPDEMMFELNYRSVLETLGYPPKVGSLIRSPFLREDWEIVQKNLGEFKMWTVIRIQLICQRLIGDGIHGRKIPEKDIDYKIV